MADVSRQSWIDNTSLENVRIADRVNICKHMPSTSKQRFSLLPQTTLAKWGRWEMVEQ